MLTGFRTANERLTVFGSSVLIFCKFPGRLERQLVVVSGGDLAWICNWLVSGGKMVRRVWLAPQLRPDRG